MGRPETQRDTLTYVERATGAVQVFGRCGPHSWEVITDANQPVLPTPATFTDNLMMVIGARLESLGWQRFPVLE